MNKRKFPFDTVSSTPNHHLHLFLIIIIFQLPFKSQFTMDPLLPELLSVVCEYLEPQDLKNVRLTSSYLSGSATATLFSHLLLSMTTEQSIKSIIDSKFAQHTRKITIPDAFFNTGALQEDDIEYLRTFRIILDRLSHFQVLHEVDLAIPPSCRWHAMRSIEKGMILLLEALGDSENHAPLLRSLTIPHDCSSPDESLRVAVRKGLARVSSLGIIVPGFLRFRCRVPSWLQLVSQNISTLRLC